MHLLSAFSHQLHKWPPCMVTASSLEEVQTHLPRGLAPPGLISEGRAGSGGEAKEPAPPCCSCVHRCETRKCRKPEAVSPELGQRIRDFPRRALPLQREVKSFLGKGRATLHHSPPAWVWVRFLPLGHLVFLFADFCSILLSGYCDNREMVKVKTCGKSRFT